VVRYQGPDGVIGVGLVPYWATHMIGHELTALFHVPHARSLAAAFPGLLRIRKEEKHDKLLQFADRVWNITEGTEDERIEAAIGKTEEFFHSLGVPTNLGAHGIKAEDIDKVIVNLEKHGMTALSERGDQTLDVTRNILEASL
jgi:NADP-dependent alcohol dehydrogenase